ncbi:CRP-like cAMP-binding protein [Desulfitobacterium sp. LBE]|uniref:Crp/Fnr family transcriptional regulator n=1 Tax=Desulfitobacterium sp. LBE TaxID=884086 RepID=UPI00119BE883|nr:Crp/Fnr family transcriptional regulator [Desulfitobacterium sp. LBE]TWH59198.1 CRP-like cAMP-binding protein [Desulfitobacterium sp. LBE]
MLKLSELPLKTYCEFNKGEYIIHQNEKINYVYKIVSGVCYRTDTSVKGSEIVYGIKSSASIGLESVLGSLILFAGRISTCNFVAHTKCCCYKIPCDDFYNYVVSHQELCVEMIQLAMKEHRAVNERFRAKSYGNTFGQLCKLLLDHSVIIDGERVVASFNNKLIGQYLGIHSVTVSKILKYLKADETIVKRKKGLVILDEHKLNSYANIDRVVYW